MAKNPEEEIARMRMLEERIKAPSIWGRMPCGIRFEDLQDRRYEEAVKFLKKHYLTEEITYRSLKITDDPEGTDEFIHNARIWMKDKMSIAVIKEGKDKLVGLLIMRIQEKCAFSRTFSRVKLTYNPIYASVMKYYNEIENNVNLFKKLGVMRYLKIYVIGLKMRYRHRGLTKELFKSAVGLAASAFVPAMAGIFTTGKLQSIAEDLGFEKNKEIYYTRYLVDGEMVFWNNLGQGNYGAALMSYRMPGIEEPIEMLRQLTSSRFNVKPLEEYEDDIEKEMEKQKSKNNNNTDDET